VDEASNESKQAALQEASKLLTAPGEMHVLATTAPVSSIGTFTANGCVDQCAADSAITDMQTVKCHSSTLPAIDVKFQPAAVVGEAVGVTFEIQEGHTALQISSPEAAPS
jgi:hypothetical protein